MLVRHYVASKLQSYYAQPAHTVVGGLSEACILNFRNLLGEFHWKRKLAALYNNKSQKKNGQWLTPVELFQPFYSQCIANWICSCLPDDDDSAVEIVELGGGRGTNCLHILNHLAAAEESSSLKKKNVYDRITQYRILDASPTLRQYQRDRLLLRNTSSHAAKIQVVPCDLLDVAEGRTKLLDETTTTTTIVLALEVLDNLPHDKIRVQRRGGTNEIMIEQAEVVPMNNDSSSTEQQHYKEVFRPLSDPLLERILATYDRRQRRRPGVYWIPTVACGGILNAVAEERRRSHHPSTTSILLADFDWLPPPDNNNNSTNTKLSLRATDNSEPLVTDMHHQDHACYLSAGRHENVDILFPTNFHKLAAYAASVFSTNSNIQVGKQSEFLQTFGKRQVAATTSRWTGYSPMVHDFANCSVLTITTTAST